MTDIMSRNRGELVLPPNSFAYVLSTTSGQVATCVGPYKSSMSETDQLVRWDAQTQRYLLTNSIEEAKQVFTFAREGQYVILTNPAPEDNTHPAHGRASDAAVALDIGKRVVIPGPVAFPLWPGQSAETIDGHHLRHNEYVLVRVYDAAEAQANREQTVIAPSGSAAGGEVTELEHDLTMGQLIVIPGISASFFMPSTGFEVLREEGGDTGVSVGGGKYVRDAVTLETLEYAVLLDENGSKRIVQGPQVVFPEPTERFQRAQHGDRSRRFRAIELNDKSGLYIKVIEEYEDPDGTRHPMGEELFITGDQQAIYFPRKEHAIIEYAGQRKHYAIAIPAGEGRYVLDRRNGEITLRRGPDMLLPDPRTEVVVQRVLSPNECELMYPGNEEALRVNDQYRQETEEQAEEDAAMAASAEPAGGGFLSEQSASAMPTPSAFATYAGSMPSHSGTQVLRSAVAGRRAMRTANMANFGGDAMERSSTHTKPRTLTLDTKYDGAVAINIWPGYAVLVSNKTGDRRVEQGPKTVLLSYDETIMSLELSTGRPKTDENLLRTGYLRTINNVVSDLVYVETRDLVQLSIELSYRVNFEGDDPLQWFTFENYVQVLTDHCRSRLRNAAKQQDVRGFYDQSINIVRDTLLGEATEGESRTGLPFDNAMRVIDVEVLDVQVRDKEVAELLGQAQAQALSGAIDLSIAEDRTERDRQLLELKRQLIEYQRLTEEAEAQADAARAAEMQAALMQEQQNMRQIGDAHIAVVEAELRALSLAAEEDIRLQREKNTTDMDRLRAEVEQTVIRMDHIQPGLIAAITAHGNRDLAATILRETMPAAVAMGTSSADILARVLKGTPLESVADALASRPEIGGSTGTEGGSE